MKIYVAGKSQEIHKVRTVQGMVKATGHEISYDWTKDVERYGPNAPGQSEEVRQTAAMKDAGGVYQARLLIVLGHPHLVGAYWECGMAVAWNLPIWTVDWHLCAGHSIFDNLANVQHMTFQEVGEKLWEFSEKRIEMDVQPRTIIIPKDD